MTDFQNSIKNISDKLAAAGESISDFDLVASTLAGLPDDYESFVDSIETKIESVNIDELHGILQRNISAKAQNKILIFFLFCANLCLQCTTMLIQWRQFSWMLPKSESLQSKSKF